MTKTRRTFPESLKREAVEQVLVGTPLRHVAQAFDIIESLWVSANVSSKMPDLMLSRAEANRAAKPPS